MDEWQPMPYAQRPSQNLGVYDWLKAGILHLMLGGAAGGAIGYTLEQVTGKKGLKETGALMGALVGAYRSWRRQEAKVLQVDSIYETFKDVQELRQTNEQVKDDNAVLQLIADHQREKLHANPGHQVTDIRESQILSSGKNQPAL